MGPLCVFCRNNKKTEPIAESAYYMITKRTQLQRAPINNSVGRRNLMRAGEGRKG